VGSSSPDRRACIENPLTTRPKRPKEQVETSTMSKTTPVLLNGTGHSGKKLPSQHLYTPQPQHKHKPSPLSTGISIDTLNGTPVRPASPSILDSPGSHLTPDTPGSLPTDAYDTILPWWRASIRRKLVQRVEWESRVLGKLQVHSTILLARLKPSSHRSAEKHRHLRWFLETHTYSLA
jgi:hypothetical protein